MYRSVQYIQYCTYLPTYRHIPEVHLQRRASQSQWVRGCPCCISERRAPPPRLRAHPGTLQCTRTKDDKTWIHKKGKETATLQQPNSYTQYIHTYVQSLWPVHTALSSESQCTLTFPEHSQSHHVGGVVLGVVLQEFLAHILPSRGGKTHQRFFVTFGKRIIGDTYSTYSSVTILGYT